jgi:hypothetical protein
VISIVIELLSDVALGLSDLLGARDRSCGSALLRAPAVGVRVFTGFAVEKPGAAAVCQSLSCGSTSRRQLVKNPRAVKRRGLTHQPQVVGTPHRVDPRGLIGSVLAPDDYCAWVAR